MILLYHKVAPETPTCWWVSADAFDRQMADLQGRHVVSLDDYNPSNPDHVVITFDGVYENVYQYAFPLLRKWGYPFELFIIGDHVGGDNAFDTVEPLTQFASLSQLEAMASGGGRLQWHTASHARLDQISPDRLIAELNVPEDLAARFDRPHFNWFAYPHGEHTSDVLEHVRERFRGALSCHAGNDCDPWQLNRVIVEEQARFTRSSVAIIIPNYNYRSYVAEAIESVLLQTSPPDEILVIDDCSTDGSMEVISRYADRVRVVRNEENLGIVPCFNKAVSLTSSSYIAFLGADNRMRSDYVERCKAILDRSPTAGVAYTDMLLFGPRASLLSAHVGAPLVAESMTERWPIYEWRFPEPTTEVIAQIETSNCIHGSSMYRRLAFEQAGGYRCSERPEDHDLFCRMLKVGWRAQRAPFPLIEYRQHSPAQTNSVLTMQMELEYYRRDAQMLLQRVESMGELGRRLDTMTAEMDTMTAELGSIVAELNQAKAALSSLRASRSWRMTAPLRAAGHLARGEVRPVINGLRTRVAAAVRSS